MTVPYSIEERNYCLVFKRPCSLSYAISAGKISPEFARFASVKVNKSGISQSVSVIDKLISPAEGVLTNA